MSKGISCFYQFATLISDIELTTIVSRLKHKDSSADYSCRLCGEHFDSFGDMQRHELVKHVQGDIDNQSEK
jgi:hypothetical protein